MLLYKWIIRIIINSVRVFRLRMGRDRRCARGQSPELRIRRELLAILRKPYPHSQCLVIGACRSASCARIGKTRREIVDEAKMDVPVVWNVASVA